MPARLVSEPPSVENTIHASLFRASSPERFSLEDDKLVLYAGASGYRLIVLDNDHTQEVRVHSDLERICGDVSLQLYVLNTSFLVYSSAAQQGLEFPYQLLILHAIKDTEAGQVLYLQAILCDLIGSKRKAEFEADSGENEDEVSTVELVLSYSGKETSSELLRANSSLQEIYDAMSACLALNFDEEQEEEEEEEHQDGGEEPALPASWMREEAFDNAGDADDLAPAEGLDGGDAGMDVDIGFGPVAGVRRREDSEGGETKRGRR